MIFLYSDVLYRAGGIETYLHALGTHLKRLAIPFRIVVAELEDCPLVDELVQAGIPVYRQRKVPGDTWLIRQRIMMAWLSWRLRPGDWVFCVRQPMPELYLALVRMVHRRGARIGASWMLAPEFMPAPTPEFSLAVAETDVVASVSECTAHQFRDIYGFNRKVHIVPYHNLLLFPEPLPLPAGPPWRIGFMGRLDDRQKNVSQLIRIFGQLADGRYDIELHIHGRGPDEKLLSALVESLGLKNKVFLHGGYDHRTELSGILSHCHIFVYPSEYEGGPCFSLLELMQAGRFCVASRVGGIPDLYAGHEDVGTLVMPRNDGQLKAALANALDRVMQNRISGSQVRARYEGRYDMNAAHRAWEEALQFVN